MTTLTADRILSGPHPQSDGTTIWIIKGESCPHCHRKPHEPRRHPNLVCADVRHGAPPADLLALKNATCTIKQPCGYCTLNKLLPKLMLLAVSRTLHDCSHNGTRSVRVLDIVPIVQPDFGNPLGSLTTFVRIVGPTAWFNMSHNAPRPLLGVTSEHVGHYALITTEATDD